MNYPLRSIAFVAELIHPPMQHSADALQRMHSVVFNDEECRYQNFQIVPHGAQMVNPQKKPNVISCCTVLRDRIQVREELTGIGRDDFRSRLLRISQVAVTNLAIPVFVVRQFIVRSLVNPRHVHDSRDFLGSNVLNKDEEYFKSFETDPDLLGLRFSFGAPDQGDGIFNVRVESYAQDARSLFLENVGTFRRPQPVNDLDAVSEDFDTVYTYLEKRIVPFIARFDSTP